MVREEPLHEPVRKTLEGDDRKPATRLQDFHPSLECPFEAALLVIQLHAERLEDSRGRMVTAAPPEKPPDEIGQLQGAYEPLAFLIPGPQNRFRYLAGPRHFAHFSAL